MIIAATGHRPDKLGGYSDFNRNRLIRIATSFLIETKPDKLFVGMALGWDQAVAQACVDLKIPFVATIPFRGMDERWPSDARRRWRDLMDAAESICTVCDPPYEGWKMQARNEAMVNCSDLLVALWNGTVGGTANCIRYAEIKRVPIINLWDQWRKDV